MTPRFQVSGIIHQLPVAFMMGGEYTQKSVMHGYQKNGDPFQLNSFKGLLVCPERNSDCLIFSRLLAVEAPLHWPYRQLINCLHHGENLEIAGNILLEANQRKHLYLI